MDAILKPVSLLSQILSLLLFLHLLLLPSVKSNADYNTLVYKICANQTFATNSLSQSLSSLFQELIPQSLHYKFFKSTAGDEDTVISGLYQCRGDLSNSECYDCVNTLHEISYTVCEEAESARVQLHGCYFLYEADGVYDESHKNEPLYKTCGETKEEPVGFDDMRNAAFVVMEIGVVDGNGFYEATFELVHVMAQCVGDLGGCDCGECVSNAALILQEECHSSDSGQVYLDRCFVSYTFNPANGILGESNQGKRNANNTGKLEAIVLGGAASLVFGFIFLKFIKSLSKKDDGIVEECFKFGLCLHFL
ncbi:Stress-antifung domain-containing protein [Cephalotus follicularis]|uniref:Stress-antifung domain-containing protein n=1 Tax=Cephalotus follicularis TaxID=3775 RepID=A0A1Q3CRY1_CEPFO|nr:Stress-antifung domain-containing protein [Cephalotus follicularis]